MVKELKQTSNNIRRFLLDLGFDIDLLIHSQSRIEQLSFIEKAINCIYLNQKTRTTFEYQAREFFKKYKALYPEGIKPFIKLYDAVQAIYSGLNPRQKSADISEVICKLQEEVNISITLKSSSANNNDVHVDLSKLDFAKLKQAFKKTKKKNTLVFDLQMAIKQHLEKLVRQNPLRLKFYEKYQKIIEEYNLGKDSLTTQKPFDDLQALMQELSQEEKRAMAEGLDEETLAIFDLLKKPKLTKKEELQVKKVAIKTLHMLKEKLNIKHWREKTQVKSQIKTLILNRLQLLPKDTYSNNEVKKRSESIYQHIYSNNRNENGNIYNGKV